MYHKYCRYKNAKPGSWILRTNARGNHNPPDMDSYIGKKGKGRTEREGPQKGGRPAVLDEEDGDDSEGEDSDSEEEDGDNDEPAPAPTTGHEQVLAIHRGASALGQPLANPRGGVKSRPACVQSRPACMQSRAASSDHAPKTTTARKKADAHRAMEEEEAAQNVEMVNRSLARQGSGGEQSRAKGRGHAGVRRRGARGTQST